jgi:cytochrome c oxidase cbb3-type subunit 4
MSYEEMLALSKSWGLVYLFFIFAGVCLYAFWPRNKAKFDRAAQMPLDEDER